MLNLHAKYNNIETPLDALLLSVLIGNHVERDRKMKLPSSVCTWFTNLCAHRDLCAGIAIRGCCECTRCTLRAHSKWSRGADANALLYNECIHAACGGMRLVRVIFYILKGVFILDIYFNEIYINNTCPHTSTMCLCVCVAGGSRSKLSLMTYCNETTSIKRL